MILHSKPLRLQRYYKKMTYANLYAIFYVFFFISRRAFISFYLPSSRQRTLAYLIYIHAKHKLRRLYTALTPIHA